MNFSANFNLIFPTQISQRFILNLQKLFCHSPETVLKVMIFFPFLADSMFGSDSMIVEENVNKTLTLPNSSSQMKGDSGNSSNIVKKKDDDDDESLKNLSGDAKCTTKFWRCLGNVIQGGAHYLQEPGGITK